jgi:hypothetical protein
MKGDGRKVVCGVDEQAGRSAGERPGSSRPERTTGAVIPRIRESWEMDRGDGGDTLIPLLGHEFG